ncbi:MAG TPA: TadE/TadG family type IV pilus assembly protein [Patescibacteria group bacterium]|nr:TadE/TadG family type IV pilus assembly protein [Patescibacteria group bacterium]
MSKHTRMVGQALPETALTLLVIIPLLLLGFQISFWVFASQIVHSAAVDAAVVAANTGNPDLADRLIAGRVSLLAYPNTKRVLFSENFSVTYFLSKDGVFTDVPWSGNAVACIQNPNTIPRWVDLGKDTRCTFVKGDGVVKISISYRLPMNLWLSWFDKTQADATAYIVCQPTKIDDDPRMPFCEKFKY